MNEPAGIVIDTDESFPCLPKAPIVEALVDIRISDQSPWEELPIRTCLEEMLPDYRFNVPRHTAKVTIEMQPTGKPPAVRIGEHGLKGLRFRSQHLPQVAAFNRDGFTFSRLEPYESWHQFAGEAMRLWTVYTRVARVEEVERIGVRYINRIPLSGEMIKIEDYIDPHPDTPRGLDLPYLDYFQRDTFDVPGYPYALTVVRTILRPQPPTLQHWAMVVDIDAFTKPGIVALDVDSLDVHLLKLRWLKNKAFFGSIAEAFWAHLKEGEKI